MFDKRKQIDDIDIRIVALLKQRQEIVEKIIAEKKKRKIPIRNEAREKEIIARLKRIYDDPLIERMYQEIFRSAYRL